MDANSEYKEIFSKNLNELMIATGKHQVDLMRDLKISSSTMSNWCNGLKLPRMDKVQMLADYFGVEVTDLLEVKGTPNYLRRYANRLINLIKDEDLEKVCGILEAFT